MQLKKMNPEIKAKWLEALRSGEYQQGRSSLRTNTDKNCCLGVLCEIAVKEGITNLIDKRSVGGYCGFGPSVKEYRTAYPPNEVSKWSELEWGHQRELAMINDGADSFAPTIKYIETNL